ncbi:MAG: PASTA domain-containing protein, partial [Bacteroidota bacterium]
MKRNKQLTKLLALHLSLMLLVLVSLLMAFSYLILPAMTHHGQSITVPNLRGYTLADAQASLAKRSLRWKVTEDFAYSPHYPPNTVIQQYPRAGAHVKQDRKIHLTLNTTIPPKVNMPNLVDGSVRNAHILLKSQELLLGNIKYVPDIAENAVLEQWHNGKPLAPGSAIAKGSKID